MHTQLPLRPNKPKNRFVVGCMAVLAILLLIGAALAWWFVARPFQQVVQAAQQTVTIQQLDSEVTNRSPFVVPEGGLLTEDSVVRYVAVLETIRDDTTGRLAVLEERYEAFGGERPTTFTAIMQLAGAYRDFFNLLAETKRSQVNALNQHGFSVDEYEWTRREVLKAAGMGAAGIGNLNTFLSSVTGDGGAPRQIDMSPAPAENIELVSPYMPQLGELGALAVFGL